MRYVKAVIATLGAVATWGITAAPDGYTQVELWGLLGVVATALAVALGPANAAESAGDGGGIDSGALIWLVVGFALGALCIAVFR